MAADGQTPLFSTGRRPLRGLGYPGKTDAACSRCCRISVAADETALERYGRLLSVLP